MRILGLDYGAKTVGTAVSDGLMLTAQTLKTIERKEENKLRRTLREIEGLIAEYQVDTVILGLPLHMDGSMSERAEKTLEFKEILEKRTGLPVILRDERLTTVAADEILEESGIKKSDRKKYIDSIAAGIILQDYLNEINDQKKDQKGEENGIGADRISDR